MMQLVGDLIDLQDARKRRKKRPLATIPTSLPINAKAFIYGLGGYARITSDCSGLTHSFPQVPGYCACGKEFYDGKAPGTGVFMDKSTSPSGGN